jgi:hypothetical protein
LFIARVPFTLDRFVSNAKNELKMGLENIAAGTAGRSIQETGPGRLGFRQAAKITILPGMIVLEKRHTRTLLLQAPAAV